MLDIVIYILHFLYMDLALTQLKALADKNRLRITFLLMQEKEICACQVVEFLQVSGATASRHMQTLQQAKIISQRKEGRWIFISICKDNLSGHLWQWLLNEKERSADWDKEQARINSILSIDIAELSRNQRDNTSNLKSGETN